MTQVREVLRLLTHLNDDLLVLTSPRGDMIDPEEWGAILSQPAEDGRSVYRYALWRIFDEHLTPLFVIMLNPSVATHDQGDRTIDGLVRRARRLGYGSVLVVNCFAYRATDPSDMRRASDPIGPINDDVLRTISGFDVDLLCAWGTNASHMGRERDVKCLISSGRARPHCLRLCAGGAPEHPLYVPGAIGLSAWQIMPDDSTACATPTSNGC